MAAHQQGVLEGDFSAAITLYHAYELLLQVIGFPENIFFYRKVTFDFLQHGTRSFNEFLSKAMADGTKHHRLR